MNPANMMKIMSAKAKFEQAHPGVSKFVADVARSGLPVGTLIEVSVTRPDGTKMNTNMKVQESDMELLESLK